MKLIIGIQRIATTIMIIKACFGVGVLPFKLFSLFNDANQSNRQPL